MSEIERIDTVAGWHSVLQATRPTSDGSRSTSTDLLGGIYCPGCGRVSRMTVFLHYPDLGRIPYGHSGGIVRGGTDEWAAAKTQMNLALLKCVMCPASFTLLKCMGPSGQFEIVIVPSVMGGLSTPNTPKPVAFYLDQAHRSHGSGANSAAMAMYRGALEQIAIGHGFTTGSLHDRILAMETASASRDDLRWMTMLDGPFLRRLKELGNGAVHGNDGDIERQAAFDNETLGVVMTTFARVLRLAYEDPAQRKAELAALEAAARAVTPPKAPKK